MFCRKIVFLILFVNLHVLVTGSYTRAMYDCLTCAKTEGLRDIDRRWISHRSSKVVLTAGSVTRPLRADMRKLSVFEQHIFVSSGELSQ